jgi:hypothetical protein
MKGKTFGAVLLVVLCFVGIKSARGQTLCYSSSIECPYGGVINGYYTGTYGTGVYGWASAASGLTFGVRGASYSTSGRGVYGYATAISGLSYGVVGAAWSTSGTGVHGYATATSGTTYGVLGQSNSPSGRGVFGSALASSGTTYGVLGQSYSTTGRGVFGSASASSGTTYGVLGQSYSTTGRGVFGSASASSGTNYGVYGISYSTTGRGVYGSASASSGTTFGVVGQSYSTTGRGVYGCASASSGTNYGVYGYAVSPSGYAVYANGRLHVTGNFTATGTKSAVVKIAGGKAVKLYAEEGSENWFFDMGSAKLQNGKALVAIDPTFAQTVNTSSEYLVFLTPEGDCEGLYVAKKDEHSFEVRELRAGQSSITFNYRIMAKRRGYEGERLAKASSEEVVAFFSPADPSVEDHSEPEKLAALE